MIIIRRTEGPKLVWRMMNGAKGREKEKEREREKKPFSFRFSFCERKMGFGKHRQRRGGTKIFRPNVWTCNKLDPDCPSFLLRWTPNICFYLSFSLCLFFLSHHLIMGRRHFGPLAVARAAPKSKPKVARGQQASLLPSSFFLLLLPLTSTRRFPNTEREKEKNLFLWRERVIGG